MVKSGKTMSFINVVIIVSKIIKYSQLLHSSNIFSEISTFKNLSIEKDVDYFL